VSVGERTKVLSFGAGDGGLAGVSVGDIAAAGWLAPGATNPATLLTRPLSVLIDLPGSLVGGSVKNAEVKALRAIGGTGHVTHVHRGRHDKPTRTHHDAARRAAGKVHPASR
jgi:hypothetical protein